MSFSTRMAVFFATMGGVGYAPLMPGTIATIVAVPFMWTFWNVPIAFLIICFLSILVLSVWASGQAGGFYRKADDSRIVIDEFMGLWTSVLPFQMKGDFKWEIVAACVIIFRIMDILKPFPISFVDKRFKNGLGVVLDDVLAGVYTCALVSVSLILL